MAKVNLASLLEPTAAQSQSRDTTDPSESPPAVTVTKPAGSSGHRRAAGERRTVKKVATVYTSRAVHTALRQYAAKQKAKGELISYGVVALLAVEKHQDELSQLWASPQPVPETAGLFGVTVRKAVPKKIPWQLHGATPTQIRTLDDLAAQWHAPTRSALVEQALTRYLDIKSPERAA